MLGGSLELGYSSVNVQVYNPESNSWTLAAPMPTARRFHAAAVVALDVGSCAEARVGTDTDAGAGAGVGVGAQLVPISSTNSSKRLCIVVCGGRDRGRSMRTCDCYDIATNTWHAFPSMLSGRAYFGAAVVGDTLYVVGGEDDSDDSVQLQSGERFNARTHTWECIAPPLVPRSFFTLLACRGRMYAVGGMQAPNEVPTTTLAPHDSVEEYDSQTNTWAMCPPLPAGRLSACGVALPLLR